MTWKVEYHSAVRKKVSQFDSSKRKDVHSFLQDHLVALNDPREIGADLGRYWRYRQKGLRLICDIKDDNKTILILEIGHSPEKIYR